jgi:hypothetical protein
VNTAEAYVIRVVCCACKAELGGKPTCDRTKHGKISHGYCGPCGQAAMQEAHAAAASFAARQAARRALQPAAAA